MLDNFQCCQNIIGKRNFEETTLEIPVGSGPWQNKNFDSGRSITYELNKDYWGFKNKTPIKVGKDNFETIDTTTIRIEE